MEFYQKTAILGKRPGIAVFSNRSGKKDSTFGRGRAVLVSRETKTVDLVCVVLVMLTGREKISDVDGIIHFYLDESSNTEI